jgi:hypothetical protein
MSLVYERRYRLSVIEQKVKYSGESAPAKLSQGYYSAWEIPPVDFTLEGSPEYSLANSSSPSSSTTSQNQSSGNTTKTTSGGDSVMITELQMTAEINSKSGEGEVAKSVIKVYNASASTRAKLERKNAYVILEAGYGDDVGIVFVGTSQRAFSRKQGTEYITEIHCIDSNVQLKTSRVSFSWPPNTTYGKIMQDAAAAMKDQGIATGFIDTSAKNLPTLPSPDETIAKGGYSFMGLTTQLLDKLCSQFNYQWSISLNELYLHARTFKNFTVQYDMGGSLIKSLEPQTDSSTETPAVETPARFKLSTFLDHRVKIGQIVNITQGVYRGRYKVVSVDTRLDYLGGGSWDSEIVMEVI